MKKLLNRLNALCTPRMFRFFRNLFFWMAVGFCLAMGYCLVAAKIVSAGYAMGGLFISVLMFAVNTYFIDTLEQDLDDTATTTSSSDSSI